MKKLSLIFFLSFFFFHLTQAQAPKDNFVHFTIEDGLQSNTVFTLLQDRFGYIWMGTNNGLVRYDGYNFKHYYQDVEDNTSIQIALVYSLYEDKNGDLWIGGVQGFGKYNREKDTFSSYSLAPFQQEINEQEATYLTVRTIAEDKTGKILLGLGPYQGGNNKNGLFYFDKISAQIKKYQLNDTTYTNSIISSLVSQTGELWLGGYSGLLHLNIESKQIKFFRPDNLFGEFDFNIASITEGKNGLLWIGTFGQGLFNFNPANGSFKKQPIPEDMYINDLIFDFENNLWIATNEGILYFNHKTGFTHKFNLNKNNPLSINSTDMFSIIQDHAGSIWIGSFDNGLNRYDQVRTDFTAYIHNPDDKNSFGPGWAVDFIEDQNQNILIGLGEIGEFINRFDPQKNNFKKMSLPGGFTVSEMYKDKHNKIWIGTWGGHHLYQLHDDEKGFIKASGFPEMNRGVILSFYEDSQDNLWFGRFNGLWLYKKSSNTLEYFFVDTLNFGSNSVHRIASDKNQNLWLGTDNGLFKFDPQTELFTRIGFSDDTTKSFLAQDVNSLYIDSTGIVWAGTWLGGLNRYDPNSDEIKIYTRKDGLPSNSVQGILGDEQNGALWLSTFSGLSRFDLKKEKFHNYDIKNGVHANEFADGAILKTSRGEFLFGGSNGFTMFKPEDIRESNVEPKIFLTDFKLSNKSVLPAPQGPLKQPIYNTNEIILSHDQNDIAFEYTAIHFVNAQGTQYAYMLENYEDNWRFVGSQRSAIYPNLPPGDYTFRVKAANYNRVWNEEGVKLSITITPPLWATWWAYILYILFGIGLLLSIRKVELNRRREKENKRLLEAENRRKSAELEEARQLQLSMLPKELPQLANLDIAVYMQTATEVGGDYYDFHVALDGTLTVVIGDATGHGMKAGTMVTTAKSLFKTHASNPDILFSFQEFTRCIKEMNFGRISMCLTMLKIKNDKMQISTAGMPPTYIYRQASKKVEELLFKGMPLGAMKNFPYKLKDTPLKTGDTILLLSDGLPELENKNGAMFGYSKIRDGYESIAEKSPEDIIDYLKNEGISWTNNHAPNDDVTFVVIKVK